MKAEIAVMASFRRVKAIGTREVAAISETGPAMAVATVPGSAAIRVRQGTRAIRRAAAMAAAAIPAAIGKNIIRKTERASRSVPVPARPVRAVSGSATTGSRPLRVSESGRMRPAAARNPAMITIALRVRPSGTVRGAERFPGKALRSGRAIPGRTAGRATVRPVGRRAIMIPMPSTARKKRLEYKEEHFDPNEPIRLNKYLANAGICSRRDADKYIQAGVVTVNGEVVQELGRKVLRTDTVLFHDEPVSIEKKVYVLLNKPKGYVTTSEDPQNRKTVMDLVKDACRERIYPVGRLDRNTTGVLLLTNDGEMAAKLTHPKFLKKKIYHVHTDQNVTAADMHKISEGLILEDGEIKVDAIEYASLTDKKQVGVEIHSGKNRIVRRIFESLGYHVVKLDRVYFAGLTKKNVRRGDWRFLTEKEVNMLRMGAFE